VVGAVKALLRHAPETAQGLLARGLQRIGAESTASSPEGLARDLVFKVRHQAPELSRLADRVEGLLEESLGGRPTR